MTHFMTVGIRHGVQSARPQAHALNSVPQLTELQLEGLMFARRTADRGLFWEQLEVGPDLAPSAYLASPGDSVRAVYLACGAHVITSSDLVTARQQVLSHDLAALGDAWSHSVEDGLLALGMKRCAEAGPEGVIVSLPPIIVAIGNLSNEFHAFLHTAGHHRGPDWSNTTVYTVAIK